MTDEKETCTLCRKEIPEGKGRTYLHHGKDFPLCTPCFDQRKLDDVYKQIQPGIEALFNQLNGGDMADIVKAFHQAIDHEHRYLQNEFFIMLWKFFQVYGSKTENQYDPRNEAAVKQAKRWFEEFGR